MGLLEQLDVWYQDKIIDLDETDLTYSHRLAALYCHSGIRERYLQKFGDRWKHFIALTIRMEKMPVFGRLIQECSAPRPSELFAVGRTFEPSRSE